MRTRNNPDVFWSEEEQRKIDRMGVDELAAVYRQMLDICRPVLKQLARYPLSAFFFEGELCSGSSTTYQELDKRARFQLKHDFVERPYTSMVMQLGVWIEDIPDEVVQRNPQAQAKQHVILLDQSGQLWVMAYDYRREIIDARTDCYWIIDLATPQKFDVDELAKWHVEKVDYYGKHDPSFPILELMSWFYRLKGKRQKHLASIARVYQELDLLAVENQVDRYGWDEMVQPDEDNRYNTHILTANPFDDWSPGLVGLSERFDQLPRKILELLDGLFSNLGGLSRPQLDELLAKMTEEAKAAVRSDSTQESTT